MENFQIENGPRLEIGNHQFTEFDTNARLHQLEQYLASHHTFFTKMTTYVRHL